MLRSSAAVLTPHFFMALYPAAFAAGLYCRPFTENISFVVEAMLFAVAHYLAYIYLMRGAWAESFKKCELFFIPLPPENILLPETEKQT